MRIVEWLVHDRIKVSDRKHRCQPLQEGAAIATVKSNSNLSDGRRLSSRTGNSPNSPFCVFMPKNAAHFFHSHAPDILRSPAIEDCGKISIVKSSIGEAHLALQRIKLWVRLGI